MCALQLPQHVTGLVLAGTGRVSVIGDYTQSRLILRSCRGWLESLPPPDKCQGTGLVPARSHRSPPGPFANGGASLCGAPVHPREAGLCAGPPPRAWTCVGCSCRRPPDWRLLGVCRELGNVLLFAQYFLFTLTPVFNDNLCKTLNISSVSGRLAHLYCRGQYNHSTLETRQGNATQLPLPGRQLCGVGAAPSL